MSKEEEATVTEPELASSDYQQVDRIVKAVQFGDLKFVETAIKVHKVPADLKDKDNCTLLHWAAINNRVEIIEFLLQCKVNVNSVGGDNGEIPLQWAVRYAHCTKAVNLLICEGSDLRHRSVYGYDALFLAVQAGHLHIIYLLLNAGANVNCTDNLKDTPLYWLLRNDSNRNTLDSQRLLLRFGASVTQRGNEDRVALHYVVESGKVFDRQAAYLIYMANHTPAALEAKATYGRTPGESAWRTRNSSAMRFLFDAYMYSKFPKWIPIAVRALTNFSFFLLLKRFGWLVGVALFLGVYCVSDLLSQRSILRGSSRESCGFAWGVILSATWAYYKFVAPSLQSVFWDWMIGLCSCCIAYTLWRAMVTQPQALYCDEDEAGSNSLVSKIVGAAPLLDLSGKAVGINFRMCPSCLVDKSLISTHCSQCDRCVVSLDHHCPFVNNCVGKGNRRVFVFFCFFASLGCLMMALLSLYMQTYILCSDVHGMLGGVFAVQQCSLDKEPTLFSATWVAFLTGIWILFILTGQLSFVASETTTFEVLKHGNEGLPPCTVRGLHNIGKFLLTGQYYVIDPSFVPAKACCSGHHHDHRHGSSESSNSLSKEGLDSATSTSRGEHSGQLQKLRVGIADLATKAQMLNAAEEV